MAEVGGTFPKNYASNLEIGVSEKSSKNCTLIVSHWEQKVNKNPSVVQRDFV